MIHSALLFALLPQTGACTLEQQKLISPSPTTAEQLGRAVSISGDLIAAGTQGEDKGDDSGAVQVFRRVGHRWAHETKLLASDGEEDDFFGTAVALEGNTVVAGAPGFDFGFPNSGAVYVFTYDGASWSQRHLFANPTGKWNAEFGDAISIDGDTFVAGAPEGGGNPDAGSAFVYRRTGSNWQLEEELKSSSPEVDGFGQSVAVSGDTLFVGAPRDSNVGQSRGSAHVFQRIGTEWIHNATLAPAELKEDARFGTAVALQDDLAFVSARRADGLVERAGAIYRYERKQGIWTLSQKLVASEGATFANFGFKLDLNGDRLVAGTALPSGAPASGSVFLFARDVGGDWIERAILLTRDPQNSDSLATSGVAIDGATIVAGARGSTETHTFQGAVYTFEISSARNCPVLYCTAKESSCGVLPRISASGTPSAAASSGFRVYATFTRGQSPGFLLYSNSGRAGVPFQGGTLCVDSKRLRRSVLLQDKVGDPASCNGTLGLDMSAFAAGRFGGDPWPWLRKPGTTVVCQFWGRDEPGSPLLSDALEYVVVP